MVARKRFIYCADRWDRAESLEEAAAGLPGKQRQEVVKDLHLVELAMCTDRRVLSLDDAQRALLHTLS